MIAIALFAFVCVAAAAVAVYVHMKKLKNSVTVPPIVIVVDAKVAAAINAATLVTGYAPASLSDFIAAADAAMVLYSLQTSISDQVMINVGAAAGAAASDASLVKNHTDRSLKAARDAASQTVILYSTQNGISIKVLIAMGIVAGAAASLAALVTNSTEASVKTVVDVAIAAAFDNKNDVNEQLTSENILLAIVFAAGAAASKAYLVADSTTVSVKAASDAATAAVKLNSLNTDYTNAGLKAAGAAAGAAAAATVISLRTIGYVPDKQKGEIVLCIGPIAGKAAYATCIKLTPCRFDPTLLAAEAGQKAAAAALYYFFNHPHIYQSVEELYIGMTDVGKKSNDDFLLTTYC
jgi:hypothetical protein